MKEDTREQIAAIRSHWASERQQAQQAQEEQERRLWQTLRGALLSGKHFTSPCECDTFLENVLEGRKPQCTHFDGTGLYWFLAKQRLFDMV